MKAVIYARFSSDNQREESIDAQVRACTDYATKSNMQIVDTYVDKALTATSDKRPEFLKMMSDAECGLFDVIIVHKLDRFSRDRYDHAYYKRKLKRCGVRLYSVLENLDDSPESIILESVLEGMSEYYSKNLARETMKGMVETALKCKHNGGVPPLGYDVANDKTYIVNERESEAVKIIFRMYASGESYNAIIDKLNSLGYKTKKGNTFGKNSLHEILRNEKYMGIYTFNRSGSKGGSAPRNNHINNPDNEIIRIPGGVPQIIDSDLFIKVQSKKRANASRTGAGKAKHEYLLSGKMICGECKGSMVGESCRNRAGDKMYFYVCSTRKRKRTCTQKSVATHRVESCVLAYLEDKIFNTKSINYISEKLFNSQQERRQNLSDSTVYIRKQLTDIKKKISNIMTAIEDGIYTPTTKMRLNELEQNERELNAELLDAQIADAQKLMSIDQIKYGLKRFKKLSKLSVNLQREAIEIFINKIIYNGDSIEIIVNLDELLRNKKSEPTALVSQISPHTVDSDLSGGGDPLCTNPNQIIITAILPKIEYNANRPSHYKTTRK